MILKIIKYFLFFSVFCQSAFAVFGPIISGGGASVNAEFCQNYFGDALVSCGRPNSNNATIDSLYNQCCQLFANIPHGSAGNP